MTLQIKNVNPEGVISKSYLSDKLPTVLTKMSLWPLPAKALKKIVITKEMSMASIPKNCLTWS